MLENEIVQYIIYFLILAAIIFLISKLTSKVEVKSFLTAIIVALVFTGFRFLWSHFQLQSILDPVANLLKDFLDKKIIDYIILGIIYIILIWASDLLIGGFKIKGLLWTIIIAAVLIAANIILDAYNLNPITK